MRKLKQIGILIAIVLLRPTYYYVVDSSATKTFLPVVNNVDTYRYLLFEYNYFSLIFLAVFILYLYQYSRDYLKTTIWEHFKPLIIIAVSVLIIAFIGIIIFVNVTNDFTTANIIYFVFTTMLIISSFGYMTYLQFFSKKEM